MKVHINKRSTRDWPMAAAYDLDQLLDQMTPETFPDVVDFGPAVGEEVALACVEFAPDRQLASR